MIFRQITRVFVCICIPLLLKSQDAEKLFNKGYHYLTVDNEKAIKFLSQSISLDSTNAEAYYFRGIARYKMEHLRDALSDYDKALALDKNLTLTQIYKGFVYRKMGQPDSAIKYFTKYIESNPSDTSAYSFVLTGKTRQNAGYFEESLKDFDIATDLKPLEEQYHYYKFISYFDLNKFEEAISHINLSIEINPDFYGYYYNKGNAYLEMERYNRAVTEFSKAIELNESIADIYYKRGLAEQGMGNIDRAIFDYGSALAYDPNEGLYFFQRGHAKMEQGDKNGACIDWYKAGELGYYEDFEKVKVVCALIFTD